MDVPPYFQVDLSGEKVINPAVIVCSLSPGWRWVHS